MEKDKRNIITILFGIMLMLCSVVGLNFSFQPDQVSQAAASSYRNKVVIYDYFAAAQKSKGVAQGDDGRKLWSSNYIVLKNTTNGEIDISDWTLFYSAERGVFDGSKFTFPKNTYIKANDFVFVLIGNLPKGGIAETTFPDFVKAKYIKEDLVWKGCTNGADGGFLLTTENGTPTKTEVITSLDGTNMKDVVDLVSTGRCKSFLRAPEETSNISLSASQHLIRVKYTDNNNQNFVANTNFYKNEEDNSFKYLTGGEVETSLTIKEVLAKADGTTDVAVKGFVTDIDKPAEDKYVFTMQDNDSAMKINVTGVANLGAQSTYAIGSIIRAVGTVATESGEKVLNVALVDAERKNFANKGEKEVYYPIKTITEINETAVEQKPLLWNKTVMIKGVTYNHDTTTVEYEGATIKAKGITADLNGKIINIRGHIRQEAGNLYIDVNHNLIEEIETIAYGQLNTLHGKKEPDRTYKTVFVEGFITYLKNLTNQNGEITQTQVYIEDNAGGLKVSAFDDVKTDLAVGKYVKAQVTLKFWQQTKPVDPTLPDGDTVTGYSVSATMDSKEILPEAPQSSTENPNIVSNITAVADVDTIRSQYMNRTISIPSATVKSVNGYNVYITFGAPDTKEIRLSLGEENVVSKGDVISILKAVVYTTNCWDVYLESQLDNQDFITTTTKDIAYVVENGIEGETVDVRGKITYVNEAQKFFYIESNGKGIKVTNAPAAMRTDFARFTGTFKKPADAEPYIIYTGSERPTWLDSDPEKLDTFTLPLTNQDITNNENLLIQLKAVRVSKIDGKKITLNENANAITLETTFEPTLLKVDDYIDVKAVLIKTAEGAKLISSDSYDLTPIELSPISKIYESNKGATITTRGVVTFIETKKKTINNNSYNIVTKMIIQDDTHAITLYNDTRTPYLLTSDDVEIACKVTVKGNLTVYKGLYELNNFEFIKIDFTPSSPQTWGVSPTTLTIAELTADEAKSKNYQSLFVTFKNVTLQDIIVEYGKVFIKLAQLDENGNELGSIDFRELYCEKAMEEVQGITDEGKLKLVTDYLEKNGIFKGDSFDIDGILDYYNSFVIVQNDTTPNEEIDYITNIKAKQYSVKFFNSEEDKTLGRNPNVITKERNAEIAVPLWDPAKSPEGKRFIGWKLNEVITLPPTQDTIIMPIGGASYYAVFEDIHYTVKFVVNNDTTIADIDVIHGNKITLPTETPVKEGFTFAGWFTTEDFLEDTEFDPETQIKDNLTLYAKWNEIPKGPSIGLIIGIVAGVLVVLAGAAVGIVFGIRKKNKSKDGLSNMENPEKEDK